MIIKRTQEVGGVDERPDVEVETGEVGHGVFGWPEVDHVPARQDHKLVHVVEDRRAGLRMCGIQTKQNKEKLVSSPCSCVTTAVVEEVEVNLVNGAYDGPAVSSERREAIHDTERVVAVQAGGRFIQKYQAWCDPEGQAGGNVAVSVVGGWVG
jgi:hypothetical protein